MRSSKEAAEAAAATRDALAVEKEEEMQALVATARQQLQVHCRSCS
jgi:hypothetical protein